MAHAVPPNFTDLATAREGNQLFVNIIGIVVDIQPPAVTRRGEHMLSFRLMDLRLADIPAAREGLLVRFFKKDAGSLPKVKNIGDAVQLLQIKIMLVNGERLCLSHQSTKFVVCPSESIVTPAFNIGYNVETLGAPLALRSFGPQEQDYIVKLRHSAVMVSILEDRRSRMSISAPTGPRSTATRPLVQQQKHNLAEEPALAAQPPAKKAKQSGTFGPKFKLVEELRPSMFADLCGVVIKKFPAQYGCDLYITDYTSNEMMRYYPKPEEETDQERDGDTFGYSGPPKREWRGPWEWFVLKVNLKPPHAMFAITSVEEDEIVLLQNVKVNISQTGSWLEGTLWAEWDNQDKIKISKLNKNVGLPEILALKQREMKYWETRRAQLQRNEGQQVANTRTKKKQLKAEKKERKRAAKLAQEAKEAKEAEEVAKKDVNRNVRCSYENVPVTKIADILDVQNSKHINSGPDGREYVLPFINARYRAKVRVVDFEPKRLEEFAVRPELEYDTDQSSDEDQWPLNPTPSYEWYFSLLLEDASIPRSTNEAEKARIWVQVHHENAQFLLGSVGDPEDLHLNKELLIQLREKLFLLWGNLYEKGDGELDNRPFNCIIQEYGIPLEDDNTALEAEPAGWKRMYAMQGASIL